MKVLSFIPDHRISATNVLVEISIKDYLEFAQYILSNNDYQRKRVIKSNLQETLRLDLLKGCTIPPIVLAVKKEEIDTAFDYKTFKDAEYISYLVDKKEMLILDGLQRTYVIIDLFHDIQSNKVKAFDTSIFFNQTIRAEIYIGLGKLGILYRMLTLNTGQTTMSTRHLMEILYLDYLDKEIDGVKLIRDTEAVPASQDTNEYKFQDILDGYYSFIENTETPLERVDILNTFQTIKSLEKTEEEKEGFKNFMQTFKKVLERFIQLSDGFIYNEEDFKSPELELSGPPFGKDALNVFKKSQSLTGFGAALNFLKFKRNVDFPTIQELSKEISLSEKSGKEIYRLINKHFDYIRNRSKKVGNDQRYYFKIFYLALFDKENEHFKSFDSSCEYAYKRVKEKIEDL
ncbi:MAG: hypothetical protein U0T84_08285 [Chitinophagales bacterium]